MDLQTSEQPIDNQSIALRRLLIIAVIIAAFAVWQIVRLYVPLVSRQNPKSEHLMAAHALADKRQRALIDEGLVMGGPVRELDYKTCYLQPSIGGGPVAMKELLCAVLAVRIYRSPLTADSPEVQAVHARLAARRDLARSWHGMLARRGTVFLDTSAAPMDSAWAVMPDGTPLEKRLEDRVLFSQLRMYSSGEQARKGLVKIRDVINEPLDPTRESYVIVVSPHSYHDQRVGCAEIIGFPHCSQPPLGDYPR